LLVVAVRLFFLGKLRRRAHRRLGHSTCPMLFAFTAFTGMVRAGILR
jgi:hypothetical protein